jgi:oxygen-independent coproporphyrinogen-3 oxidase
MRPNHIRSIGAALRNSFDLSSVEEFSVEMEVKSITPERIEAFRDIGVTHARFGVQTFNERQRRMFNLTATVPQIERAALLLKAAFPHASCDMLYGLHGQSGDELIADLDAADALGLDNIDLYPLNIFVVQKRLHRNYLQAALAPTSGRTKLYMTQAVREIMRGKGYLPHNGHGFVKVPKAEMAADPVVTRGYAFKYHQHVYGADEDEYIGLGNSALSYIAGSTITNELSRERYVSAMRGKEALPVGVVDHPAHVNAAKILAIGLPYLGSVPVARVRWEELPDGMTARIGDLVDHGLVERDANELRLTHDGWLWYVNLMFYLAPREEQASIASMVMRDAAGAYLPAHTVEQLTAIA